MRVLVCGGRYFGKIPHKTPSYTPQYYAAEQHALRERALLADTLSHCVSLDGMWLVITGGASGADDLAYRWACENKLCHQTFHAQWKDIDHPDAVVRKLPNGQRYDANAGPRRNARMIAEGKPDLVIAFSGGRGTADMIRQAEAAGIPVRRIKLSELIARPLPCAGRA